MNLRRLLVYALLSASVVALYAGLAASRTFAGYPLDDAWIHQTYARNWAETGQLAYVVGLPSAGSTAPLWTLLLSVAYRLQIEPYGWALLLGVVTLAISAWLLSRLADRLLPNRLMVSWLVGLACVLEWHLIWAAASGMETLLFIALALALIDRLWANSSGWIIGVLGGLLILTRPEGLLLIALTLGVMHASHRSGRARLIEVVKAAGALLIVLAPGAYFNLQASGSIFPNTFYAKQSEYGELMRTLPIWLNSIGNMLIAPLAGGLLLLIPGLLWWITTSLRAFLPGAPPRIARTGRAKQSSIGQEIASSRKTLLLRNLPVSVSFRAKRGISRAAGGVAGRARDSSSQKTLLRNDTDQQSFSPHASRLRDGYLAMTFSEWLPLVWLFAHVAVYALRLPVSYQHGRYLLPIIPIVLLYGVVGTVLLLDRVKARRAQPAARLLRRVYALAIGVVFVLYVPIGALAFATDVAIINGEMVVVARWLAANTPPDATIAAHDIGAIGYFTRRPILDLAGLISPDVIPFIRDEAQLGQWMQAKGADYFVTFPGWYPQLATRWPPAFAGNSPFSPEHMTVYALEPQP